MSTKPRWRRTSDDGLRFPVLLDQAREAACVSVTELARQSGFSLGHLSRVLNGRLPMARVQGVLDLASVLDAEPLPLVEAMVSDLLAGAGFECEVLIRGSRVPVAK